MWFIYHYWGTDNGRTETEKYAHVTFFFNGGVEKQFPEETRHLIPSPKVATYDKQPEMSVHGVAEKASISAHPLYPTNNSIVC